MPRTPPPPGHVNRVGAIEHLHKRGLTIGQSMFYKHVENKRITAYGSRKHKYYSIQNLDTFADEELRGVPPRLDANFSRAMLNDLPGIYKCAAKLFDTSTVSPISVEAKQAWMLKEPRGHYVIKKANGDVLAFLHIVAVTDGFLADYMAGNKTGRHLTADDIEVMEPGKPLNCIVISIGSDPDLDKNERGMKDPKEPLRKLCTSILLHGVSLDIAMLGLQGILVSRLYAFSETKEGILLCARMGMQQFAEPYRPLDKQGNPGPWRYTFYLDVQKSPKPLLRNYQRSFHEWQEIHTGAAPDRPIRPHRQDGQTTKKRASPSSSSEKPLLPDGWVSVAAFSEQHGIHPNTVKKAIQTERFTAAQIGAWKSGRAIVKEALDQDGQRAFFEQYSAHPGLKRCPSCPHGAPEAQLWTS